MLQHWRILSVERVQGIRGEGYCRERHLHGQLSTCSNRRAGESSGSGFWTDMVGLFEVRVDSVREKEFRMAFVWRAVEVFVDPFL